MRKYKVVRQTAKFFDVFLCRYEDTPDGIKEKKSIWLFNGRLNDCDIFLKFHEKGWIDEYYL